MGVAVVPKKLGIAALSVMGAVLLGVAGNFVYESIRDYRSEEPLPPPLAGGKFSIMVARLDGDTDGLQTRPNFGPGSRTI